MEIYRIVASLFRYFSTDMEIGGYWIQQGSEAG
jgi:hypothetical protein